MSLLITVDEDRQGPDAMRLQAPHKLSDVGLLGDDVLAIDQHRHRWGGRVL